VKLQSLIVSLAAIACTAVPVQLSTPAPSAQTRTPGPSATAVTVDDATWGALAARPLRLPTVAAGGQCPVSGTRAIPGTAPGAGDGPIYPVGGRPLEVTGLGNKVLFVAAPEYRGVALIRGQRVDGPGTMRFNNGQASELRFPVNTGVISGHTSLGWRDMPSTIAVDKPGCYAYQIDGVTFTTVVMVEAK